MIKLPSNVDINNLIDDLRIFSWEASDILLHISNQIQDVNYKKNIIKYKGNDDPVTLADLQVNEHIIQRINQKYKNVDWTILSEENINYASDTQGGKNWVWVFDPLDGTKDFIQGTGNYAMHLALNYKNKPLLGVVLIPARNELWISNGKDVWCEGRDGDRDDNYSVNKGNLNEMTLVKSRNHSNKILNALINKIHFKNIIEMGSIGCKIASILRGESDIYLSFSHKEIGAPKDWDFAAPDVILTTFGGAITNLRNESLKYNKKNFDQDGLIIASNNKVTHKDICIQIKEIINKNNLLSLI